MIRHLATDIARVAVALLLTCGASLAQPAPDTAAQNTAKLTTVISDVPAGTPWLTISTGLICARDNIVSRALGVREPQNLPPYTGVFKTELEKVGFKVATDDDLFNRDTGSADYQVAAVVTDERVVACASTGGLLHSGQAGDVKGTASMKVDWQVYSPVRKEVVAKISTTGAMEIANSVPDGISQLRLGAFADNVRKLAGNAQFRAAVNAAPLGNSVLPAADQSKIALLGSQKAIKRPIADAVGSVVTLQNGSGSGSGVLLSDDGYILTNAHVVGDEKQIRVRWSDGIETAAQVVRVAKPRDVALIKTNARDRPPLAIARGPVTPGQRVYAIGSPRGAEFGGTVSSGVISASRTIDGFRFIQSDVSISPGSSGGPLLDEKGSLIGITVLRYENEGPAGLNFFIPIGDAMDFLNLEQQ